MDLKLLYAKSIAKNNSNSMLLNKRLFSTYNRIVNKKLGRNLSGVNIDLGSGDKGFTNYCNSIGIKSFPYDYPEFNLEKDILPHADSSVDFVTLNAVIEHIQNPNHILTEIKRVLKPNGLIFIRTPNWKLDFKNFYNDSTHVKPYTPETLNNLLKLFGYEIIFLESGLIEKSWFWWKLPNKIKWKVASLIPGGTKSIICVGEKR
jgi:SAM-dependent methyltransferase